MGNYWYREVDDGRGIEAVDVMQIKDVFAERWRINTDLPNGWRVSTIFLSLDHAFMRDERPVVYETMVFPTHSFSEVAMSRYHSRTEAIRGHHAFVHEFFMRALFKPAADDWFLDHDAFTMQDYLKRRQYTASWRP